jgi:hypothetical protein
MNNFLKLTLVSFTFTALHLFGAAEDHWDDQFGAPGVDSGTVYAIRQVGGNVYIGGSFAAAGEAVSAGIARFDGTNWTGLAGGVSGGGAVVYAITEWNGAIYGGGYFSSAGGVASTGLARWDGSAWSSVGGGVNGVVESLVVLSNNLYVGGNFYKGGSVLATNIARWDGTNWYALGLGLSGSTNSGFALPIVYSLTTNAAGSLFAGGLFRYAGTLEVDNVARWDGSQWYSLAGGINGGPYPMVSAVISDGSSIYAAGSFRSAGGLNITNLARWDGSQWNALGGGPLGTNYALAFVGSDLYTGGTFTNIGGSRMINAAHWNGSSWEPLTAGFAGEVSSAVSSAGAVNGQLYVGGNFLRAGNAGIVALAKWDGAAWSAVSGRATKGLWLSSRSVLKTSSRLYVGGGIVAAGGVVCARVAQFDGTNWDAMAGGIIANTSGSASINAMVETNGIIYAGGFFTNAGGVAANYVAMWDGSSWSPMGSGLNNSVNALVFHQGTLFAGGAFTARGDNSASLHGIAMWDGSNWQDVPTISYWRINNIFNALVSDGTNLYAGGNYDIGWQTPPPTVTGDDLENIGYWDGTNWHSMGPALGTTVNALALWNGALYAAGSFTTNYANTATLNRIARWNGSTWVQVGAGFTTSTVNALAAGSNYLYAGGTITNSGGTLFNRIARWDGLSWSGLGSGLTNLTTTVSASGLAVAGDDLYVAGTFNRAGTKPSLALAHWNEKVLFGPPRPLQLMNPRRPQPGQFTFDITGLHTGTFTVRASTNLSNWAPIFTGDISSTTYTDSAGLPRRFYRVTVP